MEKEKKPRRSYDHRVGHNGHIPVSIKMESRDLYESHQKRISSVMGKRIPLSSILTVLAHLSEEEFLQAFVSAHNRIVNSKIITL